MCLSFLLRGTYVGALHMKTSLTYKIVFRVILRVRNAFSLPDNRGCLTDYVLEFILPISLTVLDPSRVCLAVKQKTLGVQNQFFILT